MGLIGQMRPIGPIRLIRPNEANEANRANKANKANKTNEPNKANIKERNKFGFNNTELINLVLVMFPAGRH